MKPKKLFMMCSLLFLVLLGACSKDLNTKVKMNSKWILTSWPGNSLPANGSATLNISDANKIGGKSFCNTYGGTAVFNGNAIQFSQLISTKMYCTELAAAEDKYLADLQSVNAGSLAGNKLTLMKDGKVLLIFSRAE